MVRRERAFRGISARLARHYLENLGGTVVDDGTGNGESAGAPDGGVVEGDGWTVTLSTERIEIGPTIEVTEVTTVFEGEDEGTVTDIEERFARKAMRAGG